jgi:hypothetical protein
MCSVISRKHEQKKQHIQKDKQENLLSFKQEYQLN